jgi:hypothetical protein
MKSQTLSATERKNLYELLVVSILKATLKGATVPYTSVNGNMYSYLSKDGFVALRLDEVTRNELMKKYKAALALSYGIIQKEYVHVPDSLLVKTNELKYYFNKSYEYANSLKPKKPAIKKAKKS